MRFERAPWADVRPAIDDFDAMAARLHEWARVKRETWSREEPVSITKNVKIDD